MGLEVCDNTKLGELDVAVGTVLGDLPLGLGSIDWVDAAVLLAPNVRSRCSRGDRLSVYDESSPKCMTRTLPLIWPRVYSKSPSPMTSGQSSSCMGCPDAV